MISRHFPHPVRSHSLCARMCIIVSIAPFGHVDVARSRKEGGVNLSSVGRRRGFPHGLFPRECELSTNRGLPDAMPGRGAWCLRLLTHKNRPCGAGQFQATSIIVLVPGTPAPVLDPKGASARLFTVGGPTLMRARAGGSQRENLINLINQSDDLIKLKGPPSSPVEESASHF